jgi:hypothetical protein
VAVRGRVRTCREPPAATSQVRRTDNERRTSRRAGERTHNCLSCESVDASVPMRRETRRVPRRARAHRTQGATRSRLCVPSPSSRTREPHLRFPKGAKPTRWPSRFAVASERRQSRIDGGEGHLHAARMPERRLGQRSRMTPERRILVKWNAFLGRGGIVCPAVALDGIGARSRGEVSEAISDCVE